MKSNIILKNFNQKRTNSINITTDKIVSFRIINLYIFILFKNETKYLLIKHILE